MSLTPQQLKDAAKYFGYEDADLPDWEKDGMWSEVKADVVYQAQSPTMFKVVFTTSNGDVQNEWKGYTIIGLCFQSHFGSDGVFLRASCIFFSLPAGKGNS